MIRLLLVFLFLWIFNVRAHLESDPDLLNQPAELVTSDDTPVAHGEISGTEVKTGTRSWQMPKYFDQQDTLGYSSETFKVPKGLEKARDFWLGIYTKYPSHQGVIHDSEWIDLIYEVVDFKQIQNNSEISGRQKEKLMKKMVNEAKMRASETLSRLDRAPDPATLSMQDRRIFEYMNRIEGRNRFKEANNKNRIRFQLGQSDRMKAAIYFSGRYLEEFEQIFREEKLPIELTRLVFVESSFNVLARSKVGASGLWQIMPSVARPRRMINQFVDRRNDPWDATRLAAKILASNYNLLNDWPLAITGYNHGPNGIKKLTEKYRTRDISELVENARSKKSFGFASRNFYASFLAALEAEKNAKIYFPDVGWSEKMNSVPYKLSAAITYKDLMKAFPSDKSQAEIFNPHLTAKVKNRGGPIPSGTKIYIPADKISLFENRNSNRKIASED